MHGHDGPGHDASQGQVSAARRFGKPAEDVEDVRLRSRLYSATVAPGAEAARRIKSNPELKTVPIIAVTSYALAGDEAKALACGCNAYVTKPYSPRALLAKVASVLGVNRPSIRPIHSAGDVGPTGLS